MLYFDTLMHFLLSAVGCRWVPLGAVSLSGEDYIYNEY